jgi:probable F420-dependent oxidoreductase
VQLDALFPFDTKLSAIPQLASAAEEMGFSAAWLAETSHNPFLASALVAEHTSRLKFGTGIAVSFARSPAVLAHEAWDLADFSSGRFLLGLGTQIKAHIERRFGMSWPESPVNKLREQIEVMHAFWQHWQEGERLKQRGDYYNISLSAPFFNPGPIPHPKIPILIAGVNTGLAKLAGEQADGFMLHPFHSPAYLQQSLLPAIELGLKNKERKKADFQITVNAFIVTNEQERSYVRQQLAFYASTPSYRPVLATHGWQEIGERLSALAARKRWDEMPALISDEILETYATVCEAADLPAALEERYGHIAARLALYSPFQPKERDQFWKMLTRHFNDV